MKTKEAYFVAKPTDRWKQAVAVLRELVKEEGFNSMHRAYAEAASTPLREQFTRQEHVTEAGERHVCMSRLLGKRCVAQQSYEGNCITGQIPGLDHVAMWKSNQQVEVITSQPYFFNYDTMRQTIAICEKYGLRVDVSAYSWHFPGSSLLVTFERADKKPQ